MKIGKQIIMDLKMFWEAMRENKPFAIFLLMSILMYVFLFVAAILPSRIDRKFNSIRELPPYEVSARAQALYDSLDFIADLHSDTLLWQRKLHKSSELGAMDVGRMLEAGLTLQNFTIVNKVPRNLNFDRNTADSDALTLPMIFTLRPLKAWFRPSGRVLVQARDFRQYVERSRNRLRFIRYQEDVAELAEDWKETRRAVTSGMLGIEGLQALEGDIKKLDEFYDEGVRTLGLVHFFDNEVAGSAHGVEKGGLTPFGRQVVRRAYKKRMILDLAHSSPATIKDVLRMTRRPVINSHTGVKATCNNVRNLSDQELKGIAQTGGIIGIAFFEKAVCGTSPRHIAKAIEHALRVAGSRHVALGSDFDGAIEMPFDVRGLPLLVDAMLQLGISERDIRRVMGENVRDFLLKNLPKRP